MTSLWVWIQTLEMDAPDPLENAYVPDLHEKHMAKETPEQRELMEKFKATIPLRTIEDIFRNHPCPTAPSISTSCSSPCRICWGF